MEKKEAEPTGRVIRFDDRPFEIVDGYPPNIEKIKAVFPLRTGFVYTYGNVIYAPTIALSVMKDLPLVAHERRHMRQQKGDPAGWWERYLVDREWRFKQELECYQVQYKRFKRLTRSEEIKKRYLNEIAGFLSGDMYGNLVERDEAMAAIRTGRLVAVKYNN